MDLLELAILSQLVQEDETLNAQLRHICSSLIQTTQQQPIPTATTQAAAENSSDEERRQSDADERSTASTMESQEAASIATTIDGQKQTASQNVTALQNAAYSYQELVRWASVQDYTQRPDEARAAASGLLEQCRSLGCVLSLQQNLPAIPKGLRKQKVKIYSDGVFDLVHAGHFNALRQAAQLGDELHVGICSDDDVLQSKGVYPVYTMEEREEILRACKWVDVLLLNTPYTVDPEFFATTGCDFVAHGDDVAVNADGEDCYAEVRKAGLLKLYKRTDGISTTAIIARLLAATSDDEGESPLTASISTAGCTNGDTPVSTCCDSFDRVPTTHASNSLPSMNQATLSYKRLSQFMGGPKSPKSSDKVVYVDGSFDIFHTGHLHMFEKAKATGSFLIVGIYDDETVRKLKGPAFPIQPMLHRVLGVMAIRHVDEVVMGVPFDPDENFVKSFKISAIFRRSCTQNSPRLSGLDHLKDLCEIVIVDCEAAMSTKNLIQRIKANRHELKGSITQRQIREQNLFADRQRCDEL